MATVVISCGFQSVPLDFFRKKSISKGRGLFESRFVDQVKEEIDGKNRTIYGSVNSQVKVNQDKYQVRIELREDRQILKTHCTCVAGQSISGCKHSAAVCIYINEECTSSKTDEPLSWNKPSEAQRERYKKGCRIDILFPQKITALHENFKFEEIENVPEAFLSIECALSKYLTTEKNIEELRIAQREEREQQKRELHLTCDTLYRMQSQQSVYHYYESVNDNEEGKLKLRKIQCSVNFLKFYETVKVNKDDWMRIITESHGQSSCYQWHCERFRRITSSSRAHRIKTREENFESLAKQFKNEKFQGRMTKAMEYGIKMEAEARSEFISQTGLKVYTVGLVVKIQQPYLASSPDGIIFDDESLLEIKCPYSCERSLIVDREKRISYVPYLVIDTNRVITLRESNQYYTQIQFSLYVTGLKKCHFFVYSECDSVHVIINRSNVFLSEYIPKMEQFYFKYFLPVLNA